MLALLIACLSLTVIVATNSVYISKSNPSPSKLIITCTISGNEASQYSPHLHCPLIKNHICFTNCTNQCPIVKGKCSSLLGLEAIYNCKYIYHAPDHIQLEYYIKSDNLHTNSSGEWYCSYKGINSKIITFNVSEKEKSTTTTFTAKMTSTSLLHASNKKPSFRPIKKITDIFEIRAVPTVTSKRQGITQDETQKDEMTFKTFITRFQIVIGILCLLIISIALNIVYCIRDSFVKFYIENIKNNVPSSKCLLFCVCQRDSIRTKTSFNLDRALSNETEYSKVNCHYIGNDAYDIDSLGQLIPQQCHFASEIMPSPNISRSRSFQHGSPVILTRNPDQRCLSIPTGYSPQLFAHYPHSFHVNGNYGPFGNSSLTGSETPREEFHRDFINNVDSQGNTIAGRGPSVRPEIYPQNLDLINDFNRARLSRQGSNASPNDR